MKSVRQRSRPGPPNDAVAAANEVLGDQEVVAAAAAEPPDPGMRSVSIAS